jgi:multiple sugar transport system ATP-binding protein
MAEVKLTGVRKSFQSLEVIHGIDLTIDDGAFTVLVGPSGCGKSTLLRMMAGLEELSDGQIEIDGVRCDHLLPSARGMAMVFQSYALYPHMSVEQNLRFGLENVRTPKAEIATRVARAAEILQIAHLLKRRPNQLSGGQSQRVAIGRAIVKEPKAFLFDEPLSNLDAELRVKMRGELVSLHHRLKSTMIYVTHDQVEAMTMADKIVVLRDGVVEQSGAPIELYARPVNRFVAAFLGAPQMNMMAGTLRQRENAPAVALDAGMTIDLPGRDIPLADGSRVTLGIRPEHVGTRGGNVPAVVESAEVLGAETVVHANIGGSMPFTFSTRGISGARPGETVQLSLPPAFVHVFDSDDIAVGATADWRADYIVRP